ncbi:helix-turn-helix domain-containing protein [Mycobacterium marinum]|uniref:helix-turn-helix domain-containing protein n=1 Tax=Mycobacterium marinum TaxID=1781 RepID=UPI00113FEB09|nr:helix-turn-helix domain-containing protein [Mycobacterium marinum]
MRLSDDETEAALYCAMELIDRRRRAGVPVPSWMIRLAHRLDLTSALSPRGHEIDSGSESLESDLLVGSREAADILGLSTRQVRRLAPDLDGEAIGGRIVFKRSTVIEYAEGRRNG